MPTGSALSRADRPWSFNARFVLSLPWAPIRPGNPHRGKAVISRTAGIIEQLRTVRRAFSRALRANPVPRIDRVGERVRQEERYKRVVKVREGAEETGIGTETREEGEREREDELRRRGSN